MSTWTPPVFEEVAGTKVRQGKPEPYRKSRIGEPTSRHCYLAPKHLSDEEAIEYLREKYKNWPCWKRGFYRDECGTIGWWGTVDSSD